jgi:glucose-1-phosphate thymidylyltransferase
LPDRPASRADTYPTDAKRRKPTPCAEGAAKPLKPKAGPNPTCAEGAAKPLKPKAGPDHSRPPRFRRWSDRGEEQACGQLESLQKRNDMKAIVLAAGYATRLRPLTNTVAKPLLPLAGRPMIDYIYDKIAGVSAVDAVHVVTNAKFASGFAAWAAAHTGPIPIHVHDDKTTNNEDRLGAIGDIRFTIEEGKLGGHDLLICAGDNLFDYSLADYVQYWSAKGEASCLAVYQCDDIELVKQYSIVEIDAHDRITSFIEKPKNPTTQLVGTATYIYHRQHIRLLEQYLAEGNSPDQPGNLVAWLHKRAPVFAYRFSGGWFDIGNQNELLQADNLMRGRVGMPRRDEYKLE